MRGLITISLISLISLGIGFFSGQFLEANADSKMQISFYDYQQCIDDRDHALYQLNQCNAELEACYRIGN